MTSYTPTTPHGHGGNGHHHNVYTRHGSGEVEFGSSPSSRRTEHTFMDAFRDRLNFRTRRESLNASSCDNGMLDEDLGHPPTPHDAPPGSYVGSLQSDSFLNTTFRSRSRSDATAAPASCRQSMGTIVLFPNRTERKSRSRNFRVRSERHSVCVTDLPELQSANQSMQPSHLFVDTKLANDSAADIDKQWHGPVSMPDARSSMWNPPCQSGPFQFTADGDDPFDRRQSLSFNRSDRGFVQTSTPRTARLVESEPASPFSNYAILIKELFLLSGFVLCLTFVATGNMEKEEVSLTVVFLD